MQLRRLVRPLSPQHLAAVLGGSAWVSELVEPSISLDDLDVALESVSALKGSAIDAGLAVRLRGALPLSRRQAGDAGIWEWLSAVHCPQFVWRRWAGLDVPPDDVADRLVQGLPGRFLHRPTLNGTSRNTFARLWWVAEAVDSDSDSVRMLLSNQTKFQAVFERESGLYPPLAKAFAPLLEGYPEGVITQAATRVQERLSATALELLDEAMISGLVAECIAGAVAASAKSGRSA